MDLILKLVERPQAALWVLCLTSWSFANLGDAAALHSVPRLRHSSSLSSSSLLGTATEDSHSLRRDAPNIFKPDPKEKRVMDMINKFRAEVCANMKEEHGVKFETFKACAEFMEEACRPGKDKKMDGDHKEISSGEGYCEEYFPEAEKKAKKQVDDDDKKAAAAKENAVKENDYKVVAAPSPAAAAGPSSAGSAPSGATGKAPAAGAGNGSSGSSSPAGSPSSSPAGAPSPGPAPGPFTPGKTAGKPWGPIAKDESYYYKDGGKNQTARLHMDESMKLPTQGYWGKLVEHEDMQTATGDWGREFTDNDSFEAFCRKNPNNAWCPKHGWHHSSGRSSFVISATIVAACMLRMVV